MEIRSPTCGLLLCTCFPHRIAPTRAIVSVALVFRGTKRRRSRFCFRRFCFCWERGNVKMTSVSILSSKRTCSNRSGWDRFVLRDGVETSRARNAWTSSTCLDRSRGCREAFRTGWICTFRKRRKTKSSSLVEGTYARVSLSRSISSTFLGKEGCDPNGHLRFEGGSKGSLASIARMDNPTHTRKRRTVSETAPNASTQEKQNRTKDERVDGREGALFF